uniref:Uncharacterized protein n=1 Tax=viral metagenome TaxID=1070528 RepID=A0A6C0EZ79_9ZZZZ
MGDEKSHSKAYEALHKMHLTSTKPFAQKVIDAEAILKKHGITSLSTSQIGTTGPNGNKLASGLVADFMHKSGLAVIGGDTHDLTGKHLVPGVITTHRDLKQENFAPLSLKQHQKTPTGSSFSGPKFKPKIKGGSRSKKSSKSSRFKKSFKSSRSKKSTKSKTRKHKK